MLRGAIAMAAEDGRVVVFLEPIALYHEKDLHADGDEGWLTTTPRRPSVLLPGEVGLYGERGEADVLLISYANGLRLSLQAAKRLAEEHDLRARVLDLRWLNPLPTEAIRAQAAEVGTVVVVDECRATGGGVADAIIADLAEKQIAKRLGSVRAVDSFVPLGPATRAVLVGVDQIVAAAVAAVGKRKARRRRIVMRAAVAFPGRGSYGPPRSAPCPPATRGCGARTSCAPAPAFSRSSEIDGAERFDPAMHMRPSNAWPLVFLCEPPRRRAHRGRPRGRGRGRQLDRLVHRARRIRRPRIRRRVSPRPGDGGRRRGAAPGRVRAGGAHLSADR